MSNYWKIPGIPHKGWTLLNVEDVREEGQSESETIYETCMMCGNEKIRFVHVVEHLEMNDVFRVGCICAEKMTGDYVNPKKRENLLRGRSQRRSNWLSKQWKSSRKGNLFLKIDNHILTVFIDRKANKYKCIIDEEFGTLSYTLLREAKMALFNKIEDLKMKEKW